MIRRCAAIALLPACLSSFATGNGGTDPDAASAAPDAAAAGMTTFDQLIVDTAIGYASFAKIDRRAYTSSVGAFEIDVYAHGDVRDYRAIHPEVTGSNAVAEGTVIVREVLDGSGGASQLTIIARAPAGYDASIGDLWFGVTDPAGVPVVDGGVLQVGRLDACHSCHLPRASDGYLFGVPADDE